MLKPLKGQIKALGIRKGGVSTLLNTSYIAATGAGAYTAPASGVLHVFAWGAGGSGGADGSYGGRGSGGGGGGAAFTRIRVSKGQSLPYSVGAGGAGVSPDTNGNAGGNTTVTMPSGTLFAGGGAAGLMNNSSGPSLGGSASGGLINRKGGDGAVYGGASTGGGVGGGAAGASLGNASGGGGGAGFADILGTSSPVVAAFANGTAGIGSGSNPASAPAGGSGYAASPGSSGNGGDGRILFLLMSA